MGNWLKGRVLIIPDGAQQATAGPGSNQVSTGPISDSPRDHHHSYQSNYQPSDLSSRPIYYPPYSSSLIQFATEEEQIQLAKRIGLIQHLPTGEYEGNSNGSTKNLRECVICMVEFSKGDCLRYLPCLHTYHVHCIDDWLMRSFICPSCMEPVDVALLNTL